MKRVLAALAVVALAACQVAEVEPLLEGPRGRMDPDRGAYIAIPLVAPEATAARAREVTTSILARELGQRMDVCVGSEPEDCAAAMASARARGRGYAIVLEILTWDEHDRTLFLTNDPDETELVLSVFDVETGELIERSRWTGREDFWVGAGSLVEELEKAARQWVSSVT